MAAADYIFCHSCGIKLIYDGDGLVRDYIYNSESTDFLICSKCYNKLLKKIENLLKELSNGKGNSM